MRREKILALVTEVSKYEANKSVEEASVEEKGNCLVVEASGDYE